MTEYDLGQVVGDDGKGIVSIEKTSTSGLVDTYTITYTDDDTDTFTVTNGQNAENTIAQTVTDGDTTHSPSGDAVYDYINTLIGSIETDMQS